MAYVANFEHDLFISYALVDDQKYPGVEAGWVGTFVRTLELNLSARIGRSGLLECWWDRSQLCENQPLDKQIQHALERTACLVVVLSPGFLASPWCPRELEAFRLAVEKQGRADSRIFVVDLGTVTPQQCRTVFPNYKPFDFYQLDDRKKRKTLGFPVPNEGFLLAVGDLAYKLKEEFDLISASRLSWASTAESRSLTPAIVAMPAAPAGPAIYVAETSDDLTTDRVQLISFLESHQFRVVCGGRGVVNAGDWQAAAARELATATCFVQLLGLYPGRELEGATSGLVKLQHELAITGGKKVLQWRAPDLLGKIFDDPAHAEFVKMAEAIECPLEEFKAEVKRLAAPLPPPKPVERPPAPGGFEMPPMVFIHAGVEDIAQAGLLSKTLEEMNCWVTTPLTHGEPDKIRGDLEANLIECDGLIVFYGAISPDWVRAQFRSLPRILPKRNVMTPPRPLKALAICSGEPPIKPDHGIKIPGMEVLDLAQGTCQDRIRHWVEQLRNGSTP